MVLLASQSSIRFVEVLPEQAGQRIDNYLLRILKGVPKSRVYRLLRKGEMRVNQSRVQPDYRIQAGDRVRIPPLRMPEQSASVLPPRSLLAQLEEAILFEDHEVLILNKPTGLAVHKGSGLEFGVIESLRALRPQLPFLELAHRLDRETSGCLVLAKTPQALRMIQAAQRMAAIDKGYLALVQGHWNYGAFSVEAPLQKNVLRSGERRVEVSKGGKPAFTRFKPISLFRQASLLEVSIATGRTHQIRVHAAFAGHPVAGDDKYGDARFNKEMRRLGLHRLFLHAHSIAFSLGGREISVSAPLDEPLKSVLEQLEASQ